MGQAFGCIQVVQSTVAVKEKCGQFDRLLKPGCHCLPWCLCHRVAGKVSFRVQQLDVRCEAKTKDNAFVTVVASIQYSVMEGKANDAFYKLSDAKGLIQANVFNVIRVSVSKMNWDSAFEEKDAIAKEVEAISECGIKIVKTLIMDIEPHSNVKKAMNEKNAEAIKRAAENNAEEEEILKIKRAEAKAEAEKILLIKRAEAKAEAEKISQIKRAEGEAEAEKILLIKRAEGKAEAEKILQINRAEGQAESKSHRPSDCGRTEGQPACFL